MRAGDWEEGEGDHGVEEWEMSVEWSERMFAAPRISVSSCVAALMFSGDML